MPFSKIIYAALSAVVILSLPFLVSGLDWSNNGFLPLAVSAAAAILVLAAVNFRAAFLTIIFLLPAILHFNYLKINLFAYLPFLNDYVFFFNPASLVYLLLVLFTALAIIENRSALKTLSLKYPILLAALYAATSLFWSADVATGSIELIYLIVPFGAYLVSFLYFSQPATFLKLWLIAALSSIIPLIVAAGQLITGAYFYEPDSSLGRLTGGLDHPNTFGLFLFLIIGLAVSFYLARPERGFKKNRSLFFFVLVCLFFLVLTYSRTSWFSLGVFCLLLIFQERKIILLLPAGISLIGAALLLWENLRYRLMEVFDQALFNSVVARLNIWRVSLDQVALKPFFGHGVGSAEAVITGAKTWQGGISLPHNDYLLQALELGLAGLIIFLIYTFGALYYLWQTFKILSDKKTVIKLYGRVFLLNYKTLAFGLFVIFIALLPATMFESLSQKILLQIILWSLLGGIFGLKKLPA